MSRTGILYREVTVGFDENDEPIKKRIGFSFTMNFWNELCKREGISISGIGSILGTDNPRLWDVYMNILYCAALAYAEVRDIEFTYKRELAGEWISDMPQEEFNEMVTEMLNTRIFGKNLTGLRANKEDQAA